ncbi:IS30 family transposase [Luteimonas sp. SJ-92]|uniref:IS30 family transposase n=1 Tax=Luteimonas salinisoli TaxID=2752307 RepID=A0A853JDR1_9GAMM|nr:IS30 family transposase [Luteimonas salinisoli]NZA26360.1 IS30 family transposase [Luteimonas salinisoli]NZA26945.1 IS30 family transposase [Luteimonas salinisoli]NZA27453.1 IS30 family transposase [Luteimonas salinisoli]
MYHQLTEQERYTLSVLHRDGQSLRTIARILDRSPSTISREIQRNRCHRTDGAYRPSKAQQRTNGRRRRTRQVRQHDADIYGRIEALLRYAQWSPEQIARWLALHGVVRISHMTIYRHVHRDRLAGGQLRSCLRQGGKRRRKRTFGPERRGKLHGKPMIDSRPAEVEGRQEVGHWEGDTVVGTASERVCLLTLVERCTGVALVVRLPHRTVKAVNRAALDAIQRSGLPFKTITWDNGTEFHGYRALEQATGVLCYFAYPHRPWERGSNENFNGLLRQYLPKGRSLARTTQADCNRIAHKLNTRPRKRHGYKTPIERMQELSGVLHLGC